MGDRADAPLSHRLQIAQDVMGLEWGDSLVTTGLVL